MEKTPCSPQFLPLRNLEERCGCGSLSLIPWGTIVWNRAIGLVVCGPYVTHMGLICPPPPRLPPSYYFPHCSGCRSSWGLQAPTGQGSEVQCSPQCWGTPQSRMPRRHDTSGETQLGSLVWRVPRWGPSSIWPPLVRPVGGAAPCPLDVGQLWSGRYKRRRSDHCILLFKKKVVITCSCGVKSVRTEHLKNPLTLVRSCSLVSAEALFLLCSWSLWIRFQSTAALQLT